MWPGFGQPVPGYPLGMPQYLGMPMYPGMPHMPPGYPPMMPGYTHPMAAMQGAPAGLPPMSMPSGATSPHAALGMPGLADSARGDAAVRGAAGLAKSKSRSRTPLKIPKKDDDKTKLSTSYKTIGATWSHPDDGKQKNRFFPKRYRTQLIEACDPDRWPVSTLSQLDDEDVDYLLFITTTISPLTNPREFGCKTKGEFRASIARLFRSKMARNPSRLSGLSEELDNLGITAMKMGYREEWLSPERVEAWRHAKGKRVGMPEMQHLPRASPSPDAKSGERTSLAERSRTRSPTAARRNVLALEDGRRARAAAPSRRDAEAVRAASPSATSVGSRGSGGGAQVAVAWSMPEMELPKFKESQSSVRAVVKAEAQNKPGQSGRRGTSPVPLGQGDAEPVLLADDVKGDAASLGAGDAASQAFEEEET